MFYFAGIIIALFLCMLLLVKKQKSRADKVLAAWLGLLTVHLLFFYFRESGMAFRHPHLLGLGLAIPPLHGAMAYWYVLTMTRPRPLRWAEVLLPLLPGLLLLVLAIPFYRMSGAEKLEVFRNQGDDFAWYQIIQISLVVSLGFAYMLAALWLIRRHRCRIQEVFSNTDRKNLRWLEYLNLGLGLIWILVLFLDDQIIFGGVVLFVLFIGFFGINQLPIFTAGLPEEPENPSLPPAEPHPINEATPPEPKRYAKSGLDEGEARRIFVQLRTLMEERALYRKNDLTLAELARELDTHPNYLSQVINEKEEKNFYQYINTLRVGAFVELAARPESKQFTLLALAFDCGFNSKSTFNKYFKEVTGKTPSEFFES